MRFAEMCDASLVAGGVFSRSAGIAASSIAQDVARCGDAAVTISGDG